MKHAYVDLFIPIKIKLYNFAQVFKSNVQNEREFAHSLPKFNSSNASSICRIVSCCDRNSSVDSFNNIYSTWVFIIFNKTEKKGRRRRMKRMKERKKEKKEIPSLF